MIRYIAFWFVLALVAVLNGIARTSGYGRFMPELAAHQLSTLTGILATGVVTWLLWKRHPLDSSTQAWTVGSAWLTMTLAFEFLFGHFVVGHPWSRLLADYNLLHGRVWVLFLIWVLVMPYLFWRLTRDTS